MHIWILIFLYQAYGGNSLTVTFNTLKACEVARDKLLSVKPFMIEEDAFCIEDEK